MKYILVLFLLISARTAIAASDETNYVYTSTSWLYGTNYTFVVTGNDILHCKPWNVDEDEPPLSVKRAGAAAQKELKAIIRDSSKWYVYAIELIKVPFAEEADLTPYKNRWVYKIHYMPPMPRSGYGAVIPSIGIVVLTDGTAIHPKMERGSFPK